MSLRRRLRSETGLSMIIMLSVLTVTSMIVVAAYTSAQGEVKLTALDVAGKRAYYAAQAGISEYASHLAQDSNYLAFCTSPNPANPALNQLSEGTKHKVDVPGTTNEEYAIDLLPAESAPSNDKKCDPNNVSGTMIEGTGKAAGTFRIESTGFSEGQKRRIVATFRNANFVSYVWYDVYETGDPALYGEAYEKEPSKYALCGQYWGLRPEYCTTFNNYFISGESVRGPMHTEDHVGISGDPTFGRSISDRIEFGHSVGGDSGYSCEEACGAAEPKFVGTHVPPSEVPSIKPPPGDEELEHIVEPAYHFTDKTKIVLEGEKMTVEEHVGEASAKTVHNLPFPENGVVYVSGGCSKAYSPFGPKPGYSEDTGCGNVYVKGEYTKALTIGSQNDVIINGNILTPHNSEGFPTTNAMLGLIANNFIRIFHPVSGTRPNAFYNCNGVSDTAEDLKNVTIYAALLALKHSLIVDNFDCGAPLGSINFFGAVASNFSNGMTGVFSGTSLLAGYGYNAEYDYRLQSQEPPHFLNPIQAAWYIQRETIAPCVEGCG
ncbi:MAG TPA: hypothetical protein VMA83_04555 [Solirubrobacteraceae bacterium]|nr:hypothetical protein [Solirubrobacteraceae bacterium]